MELPAVNLKGLHCVPRPLCLGQLHHPGLGRVGRGAAGLRRRHKYVSGWPGGHHLPGHRPHQHLLPEGRPLGHGALQRRHGHPQPAPQAVLLLPRLPHVPGARGFPRAFAGAQRLPDHRLRGACRPGEQASRPPRILKPAKSRSQLDRSPGRRRRHHPLCTSGVICVLDGPPFLELTWERTRFPSSGVA
ncbi:type-1 angiotensin II receptor-associated protein isoform X1 [Phacochoerus africanus]|uniref:type-1 angiotensin II receptor-associated protein isoform X1 n=2 Tax=Phacochoerus africanus TaxID=41426 RepID=UPI001FD962F0|nr:type-1 angiotensin II receptor-associated protein isoform X1 [Phacochoerus africanus]